MRKEKLEELKQYIEELKTIKFNKTSGTFLKSEGYNCTLNNGVIIKREKLIKGNNDGSAVIIMPVTTNNEILTVIEPRVFTKETVGIGLPAGYIEKGEDVKKAAIREMYEETGLTLTPVDAGCYEKPFFTSTGMTDETCAAVFGYLSGDVSNSHQEATEDIEVVLADKEECRRILKEENVAIMCAYMLMHFINDEKPFGFIENM